MKFIRIYAPNQSNLKKERDRKIDLRNVDFGSKHI